MTMEADLQTHVAFHLTGRRPAKGLDAVDPLVLRPALFARYRDLAALRYDYPAVLVRNPGAGPWIEPLSGLVERAIRSLVSEGARGSLASLWDKAVARLGARNDETMQQSLNRARASLKVDGDVVDCDAAMPAALFTHAWRVAQERKAQKLAAAVRRLSVKLAEILRADFVRSDAGRSAQSLKAAIGGTHGAVFDFDAMSHVLAKSAPKVSMPPARRQRIEALLAVLQSQAFVAAGDETATRTAPYTFAFESCTAALTAYRGRSPTVVELAKAIAIAELEIKGEYKDDAHDDYFAAYGADGLTPEELALFPDYLVTINSASQDPVESAALLELLSAGLPIKVLVQTDDILEEREEGEGNLNFANRSRQLANMALG